jgi:hypothetical protein
MSGPITRMIAAAVTRNTKTIKRSVRRMDMKECASVSDVVRSRCIQYNQGSDGMQGKGDSW